MKIAVSEYKNHVATAFDFANNVVVFTCENGKTVKKEHLMLDDHFIPSRSMKLKNLGIDKLICGAISNPSAFMLQYQGIEVISGITGNVDVVIGEFLRGNINSPQYLLPGFSGMGCVRTQSRRQKRGCRRGRKNQSGS